MADNEQADKMAPARMAGLRKQADDLGVMYTTETSEEALRTAIKEAKAPRPAAPAEQTVPVQGMVDIIKAVKDALRPDQVQDGIVSEADADPSDATEERAYFHPAIFWKLPMKKVGGQLIKPPFRPLMFKQEQGGSVRNGNQWNTRYLSVLRTKSKREQAYIETHELFGRSFSRSYTEAQKLSTRARRGIVFGRFMQSLMITDSKEIYRMAANMNLNTGITEDLATLRTRIADELTEKECDRLDKQEAAILAGSGKKSLLTTGETV